MQQIDVVAVGKRAFSLEKAATHRAENDLITPYPVQEKSALERVPIFVANSGQREKD